MQKCGLFFIFLFLTFSLRSQDSLSRNNYFRLGTGLLKEISIWHERPNNLIFSIGYIHGQSLFGPKCSHWVSDERLQNSLRRGISLKAGKNFKNQVGISLTPMLMYRYQAIKNLRQYYPNQSCYQEPQGSQRSDSNKHSISGIFYLDFDRKGRKTFSFYCGLGAGFGFSTTTVKTALVDGMTIDINYTSKTTLPHVLIDLGMKINLGALWATHSTTP